MIYMYISIPALSRRFLVKNRLCRGYWCFRVKFLDYSPSWVTRY